ncbi:hypothetical protein EON65_19860 [archaeon]|nr:MAG: hypothetical protein EON65_19860 [archaeon]
MTLRIVLSELGVPNPFSLSLLPLSSPIPRNTSSPPSSSFKSSASSSGAWMTIGTTLSLPWVCSCCSRGSCAISDAITC